VSEAIARVRDQALEVGRGWSGPDAPASWALTAALFSELAADDELLTIAAAIPAAKLPALLFVAAVQYVAARHPEEPFAAYYPSPDAGAQPALDDAFPARYRQFCLDHREDLAQAWHGRTYQMNEVARSTQVALALAVLHEEHPEREVALVDVGTGAGLGLFPDRYAYRLSGGAPFGDPASPVHITCVRQGARSPRARQLPAITSRTGIDLHPIDLNDAEARAWLTACVPPEIGALSRAGHAIDLVRAARPAIVRGSATDDLEDVLARCPDAGLLCVLDTYTAVFLDPDERRELQRTIASCGAGRDVAWISLDPLVPLGTDARDTVQRERAPQRLIDLNASGGVFGVLSLLTHIGGTTSSRTLAIAHPSGTRMEWLDEPTSA
jgi:hypothetical protein